MVAAAVEPINNGPWGAIAMLATRIIAVQKFDVIGDGQVAQGFRHWCCTAVKKQCTTIVDAGLRLRHCGKGKMNAKP
ncbi:unnamed protein product [Sphagnum jensenii]|uniref:Uncharacterized protein n=1 Tax=Sphagnum jensenii TaxID=128206 RepID=A0ABP1BIG5_9BRYO